MRSLRIKNWENFQHYKHRSPPWIKLHREIANDYAFAALPDKAKAHLLLIWVLGAGSNGEIPFDEKFIAGRIGATEKVDLQILVDAGFLLEIGSKEEKHDVAPKGNGSAEAHERKEAARRVLAYLNERTGKKFHEVDANLDLIVARLKEFDEKMLRSIILLKCDQWSKDEKMAEYLRPATLFSRTHCAQYAGELA